MAFLQEHRVPCCRLPIVGKQKNVGVLVVRAADYLVHWLPPFVAWHTPIIADFSEKAIAFCPLLFAVRTWIWSYFLKKSAILSARWQRARKQSVPPLILTSFSTFPLFSLPRRMPNGGALPLPPSASGAPLFLQFAHKQPNFTMFFLQSSFLVCPKRKARRAHFPAGFFWRNAGFCRGRRLYCPTVRVVMESGGRRRAAVCPVRRRLTGSASAVRLSSTQTSVPSGLRKAVASSASV